MNHDIMQSEMKNGGTDDQIMHNDVLLRDRKTRLASAGRISIPIRLSEDARVIGRQLTKPPSTVSKPPFEEVNNTRGVILSPESDKMAASSNRMSSSRKVHSHRYSYAETKDVQNRKRSSVHRLSKQRSIPHNSNEAHDVTIRDSAAGGANQRASRVISSLHVNIPAVSPETVESVESGNFGATSPISEVQLRRQSERVTRVQSINHHTRSHINISQNRLSSTTRKRDRRSSFLSPKSRSSVILVTQSPSPTAIVNPPAENTDRLSVLRDSRVMPSSLKYPSAGLCEKCLSYTCPRCLTTSLLNVAPEDTSSNPSFSSPQPDHNYPLFRNSRAKSLRRLISQRASSNFYPQQPLPDFRQLTLSHEFPDESPDEGLNMRWKSKSVQPRKAHSMSEVRQSRLVDLMSPRLLQTLTDDDEIYDDINGNGVDNLIEVEHNVLQDDDGSNILRPEDIRIIHQLARRALGVGNHDSQIAASLKHSLDIHLGRVWHVVAGYGPYGSNVASLPGALMHFKIGNWAFLVWKTPDE